jgi:hypothetical protein
MTLLNKDALYYLGTPWSGEPYKEIRNDTFVWQSYEDSPELFYCYEFGNAEAFNVFPLDTLLTAEQINHIRTGEASLAVSNSHEAFHYIVPVLYQTLAIQHNIPPEHIILISESADIASHINTVSSELNMGKFRSRWLRRFEYDIQINRFLMGCDGPPFVNGLPGKRLPDPVTLENKHYDKKFLCFNRRWRGNRTVLVSLLHALDLLKHGHVSLGRSDDNRDWYSATYRGKYFMDNHPEATALLESIHEELITSFPELYLDSDDLVTNRAILDASTNYLYTDTYFSVVTETFFFRKERPDEYGRFLSEKTFKPVAMRHPFIIVSTPHFLDKFKEIGYKSFSPWIDESYDKENDDATRMMMIVREIERLSKLSTEELEQFLIAMREICEHNYKVLKNKKLHDFYMDLDQ